MISLEVSTKDDIGSVKKLPLEEKNRRGGRLLFQFPPPKHHWQNYYLSIFPLTKLNSGHDKKEKWSSFFQLLAQTLWDPPASFFLYFVKWGHFVSNQWQYLKNPPLWSKDAFYEIRQRKHIWASGHSIKFKNKNYICAFFMV